MNNERVRKQNLGISGSVFLKAHCRVAFDEIEVHFVA